MIIKLKIKHNKKTNNHTIIAWIQRCKEFNKEILQLLQFFKDQIRYYNVRRFYKYFRVKSENPAIMMSFISTIQDLIPEVYFNQEESAEIEKVVD